MKLALQYLARKYLLVFAIAGGMSVLAENAYCVDMSLPVEVQALIGMKIPPIIAGKASANIPNFVSKTSGWGAISFDEGIVGDKWPVFIVELINADRSREVLDVQLLPNNLIDWRYLGRESEQLEKFKHVKNRFSFSTSCRVDERDERLVFGLVKPEKGKQTCSHFSKRVKLAWLIDRQSGKISPMQTQGLQCFYLTMDDCF
jgi:hypothetical protein